MLIISCKMNEYYYLKIQLNKNTSPYFDQIIK